MLTSKGVSMDQVQREGAAVGLEFRGRAGEYFRIWIVNVCLTVITLGIYSAWAKVRRNRYLYASTLLAGAPLEYRAQPVQILKGRMIAVGALAIYALAGQVYAPLQVALVLLFLALLPWLIVRARGFALRNTAYRNITFGFRGQYGEAARVHLGWPLLSALSMGFLYPLYVWRRAKFAVEGSRYGSQSFSFLARPGGYYAVYLKVALLFVVIPAAAIFLVVSGLWAGLVLALLALLATLSYLHTALANLTWSSLEMGGMRIESRLATGRMFWIALSNLVAVMASIGLLIPWATVRMARYRVEQLRVAGAQRLDALVGSQAAEVGAAGEELSEMLAIDFGI